MISSPWWGRTARLSLPDVNVLQGIGDGPQYRRLTTITFKSGTWWKNQKLFRVSRQNTLDTGVEDQVIAQLGWRQKLRGSSFLISSMALLRPDLELYLLAEKHNLLLFGDPLAVRSAFTCLEKFLCSALMKGGTPALQDSGLEQLSQRLLQITGSERLVMKLGPEGFIVDRAPMERSATKPSRPVSEPARCGAGDSLLAPFATGQLVAEALTAALACCGRFLGETWATRHLRCFGRSLGML